MRVSHDPHTEFVSSRPPRITSPPSRSASYDRAAFAPRFTHSLQHLFVKMSFTISLSAVRPMASGLHHAETRRAERFPKIPSTAPRNAVRACGKKSGDIHNELKEKFTTGGSSRR